MIHHGDCLEVVAGMESESVDAIVTDPPYGLGFMGKEWDALPPGLPWAEQCLRVLKPGGHLVAFGGSRTYHRLAVAIEDAGFEIRDQLQWLYGSGFPKSLDVSKAIDKAAGAEREVVGPKMRPDGKTVASAAPNGPGTNFVDDDRPWKHDMEAVLRNQSITAPATPDAQKWQGYGTALKPAHEPIVLARKPLSGTVASTVLEHGTGALNIDGCRVGTGGDKTPAPTKRRDSSPWFTTADRENLGGNDSLGRWPANLILDEVAGAVLDGQSGEGKSGVAVQRNGGGQAIFGGISGGTNAAGERPDAGYGDTGGASRFFYTAKAGRGERNAGLDGFDPSQTNFAAGTGLKNNGDGTPRNMTATAKNVHPTVKPIDVMRWLVRLVTPPGGTVLDPFTGSGTTGIAAGLEGFGFIGIEREAEYLAIAEARIAWWGDKHGDTADILVANGLAEKAKAEHVERGQLDLLGEAA
jgi:DNA modification methylase